LVRSVENYPFSEVNGIPSHCPNDVVGTFKETLDAICEYHEVLDTKNELVRLVNVLTEIYASISREDKKHATILDKNIQIMGSRFRRIQSSKQLRLIFPDKHVEREGCEFKQLYRSMSEFSSVRTTLLDMEKYLQAVNVIDERTTKCSEICNLTASIADKTPGLVDSIFLENYASLLRDMANTLESYGQLCQLQTTIEHNHILNIQTLHQS
jgi:hypothetical protein